ncbi:hypothetical protein J7T55_003517 [Diaporthe amygdali]|uniref:uncharacterized protein n=1 Tax=Phomopsis amygdali TaxID=1214568 RepID=UPI0022FEC149|nr:uncharacterized protein J7T55_003517 [Diaporthe amygdali]KAJ0117101.1 hypothetical protein J7T55_003517 [Diaporthe amygdali]
MASAQLAIAKASLFASLLKADADADLASCSRDEIEQFHGLLNAAVAKCSPTNVQKCKQWILQHLVPSPTRAAAFGKYLVALASSFPSGSPKAPGPSSKRRRLHVLYVLNDVLFHVKFRTHHHHVFFDKLESHLPALFKSAASFANAPKQIKKLQDLIQLWEKKGYFSDSVLKSLRAAVDEGPKSEAREANGGGGDGGVANKAYQTSTAREAPFILPSMHGDASAPWYDLPAANWLPVIEPNSTRPMNPNMIKPLQLAGGAADKNLVAAVKKLLGEVDKIYAKDTLLDGDSSVDISQMGEIIERDEMGDIVGGETYYGWSRNFWDAEAPRARAASPGVAAGGLPQGETPRAQLPNDVDFRAHEAGAGVAHHDLAAAQGEAATAQGAGEAIRAPGLDPALRDVARMAETDPDPDPVPAAHIHHNQCSLLPGTCKQQAMAHQKALCRQTRNNITTHINNISHRRRRQLRTHLRTCPPGHHHNQAGSTLGTQARHHLLRLHTTKVTGLLRLRHHTCLLPEATQYHHPLHRRAGSHHTRPRAGLPSQELLQARGPAVGRRLHHRHHPTHLRGISSSNSNSQEGSSTAGVGMVVVDTGDAAAAAAGTAGEEDGDRSYEGT